MILLLLLTLSISSLFGLPATFGNPPSDPACDALRTVADSLTGARIYGSLCADSMPKTGCTTASLELLKKCLDGIHVDQDCLDRMHTNLTEGSMDDQDCFCGGLVKFSEMLTSVGVLLCLEEDEVRDGMGNFLRYRTPSTKPSTTSSSTSTFKKSRSAGPAPGYPGEAAGPAPTYPGAAAGPTPAYPGAAAGPAPAYPGAAAGPAPTYPGAAAGPAPSHPGAAAGPAPGHPGAGPVPAHPGAANPGAAPGLPYGCDPVIIGREAEDWRPIIDCREDLNLAVTPPDASSVDWRTAKFDPSNYNQLWRQDSDGRIINKANGKVLVMDLYGFRFEESDSYFRWSFNTYIRSSQEPSGPISQKLQAKSDQDERCLNTADRIDTTGSVLMLYPCQTIHPINGCFKFKWWNSLFK